jgi:hypothetical protein
MSTLLSGPENAPNAAKHGKHQKSPLTGIERKIFNRTKLKERFLKEKEIHHGKRKS